MPPSSIYIVASSKPTLILLNPEILKLTRSEVAVIVPPELTCRLYVRASEHKLTDYELDFHGCIEDFTRV